MTDIFMTAIVVRFPTGDYCITEEGMVERTIDGVQWESLAPVIGLGEDPLAITKASAILAERQKWYDKLWDYSREEVTAAAKFADEKNKNILLVAPTPVIAEICKVFFECRKAQLCAGYDTKSSL